MIDPHMLMMWVCLGLLGALAIVFAVWAKGLKKRRVANAQTALFAEVGRVIVDEADRRLIVGVSAKPGERPVWQKEKVEVYELDGEPLYGVTSRVSLLTVEAEWMEATS